MKREPTIIRADNANNTMMGNERILKLNVSKTAGDMYLVEGILPKGSEISAHIHTYENEIFHVLKGKVELILGDKKVKGFPGDILPRNVKHAIKTLGDETAQVLNYVFPGKNFETFFNAVNSLNSPTPEQRAKLTQEYGLHFL